jgi:peptidoglycan L-alanyl-D-glutamate endopeptidase CwlK
MPRLTDLGTLHPLMRAFVKELLEKCHENKLPLEVYEAGRSPFRQAELYALGRTTGERGKIKTRAHAYDSFHQFGFAIDGVFVVNGKWSWDPPSPGAWDEYTHIVESVGLRPLSSEKPHAEMALKLSDLHAGKFPPGGDESWRNFLEREAELWGRGARTVADITHPGAPGCLFPTDRPTLPGLA